MVIGDRNDFKAFVYGSGLALKYGEKLAGRKPSHLMLDGGILIVPPEREREFLNIYARELLKGTDLYVVEQKTAPLFHFMSEFDIKLPNRQITDTELSIFVHAVQRVMAQAYPNEDVTVAVSTAPPKETSTKDKRPAIQSGVHMNWRILVDLETAWVLRAWIMRELDRAMPATEALPLMEPWYEGYDPCVLLDNGLRMIGSKKADLCPVCKNKSTFKRGRPEDVGSVCAHCHGVGRMDMGRPYTLVMLADREGNPKPEVESLNAPGNIADLVNLMSIRQLPGEPTTAPELSFPDEATGKMLREAARIDRQNARKPQQGKKKQKDGAASSQQHTEKKDELVDVTPDDPILQAVSNYIISEFRGAPVVSRVKRTASKDCYIVNTRSHFCENKNGDHGHSCVYFMIRTKGCVQRCFCQKSYGPYNKPCSQFVGSVHRVPNELLCMMFPNALMAAQRKEEKREAVAARLMSIRAYGDPPAAIDLPRLTAPVVEGMRRRGISPRVTYESIRSQVTPPYTISRFVEDLRAANRKTK